jgi:hypothetical protein
MRLGIVACAALLTACVVAFLVAAPPAATPARCHLRWRLVPSPSFSHGSLDSLDVVNRAEVWVVRSLTGDPQPVLFERWNGRRWRLGRLAVKAAGAPLSLSASSSRDVWIVGETSAFKPLILHYNGYRWASLDTPSAPKEIDLLNDVVALAPNNAWVVGNKSFRGGGGQSALIWHWDGISWTSVDAPAGLENMAGVAAVSPDNVWAVAPAQEDPAGGLRVIVAHWNGASWREVNTGLRAVDLVRVRAVSATDVWAVGSTSGTAERGIVVHWNGREFRVVRKTGRLGSDVFFDVATAGRQVWAVGDGDIEHWDGRRWQRTHIKGINLFGADALSARNVWAAGVTRRGGPAIYHYACR